MQNLLNFDKKHIWHPYTQITKPLAAYEIISAKGLYLELKNKKKLIDGMSSWWAAIFGYNHPVLNKALFAQAKKMSHVMFGGITHEPAVKLASLLIDITDKSLNKIFFADSGSVAVEVAIKMAIQYSFSIGKSKKNKLLTIKGGYHGDTFCAMSVCDPVNSMHSNFSGILTKHFFADLPKCGFYDNWDEKDIKSIKDIMKVHHEKIAAVILEPIVQGAGGMRFYSPSYLKSLRKLCDEYEILLIFDEIATGFGRTKKLFAYEHANIIPDILCLGKALTGGYMTLSATLCNDKVANNISGPFMHGPTFMGNPLACSVAYACVDLLLKSNWQEKVEMIEKELKKGLEPCASFDFVEDVRILGAIGVVELKFEIDIEKIQKEFVRQGVWIRPFNKLIYLMPPFISTKLSIKKLCSTIYKTLNKMKDNVFVNQS